MEFRVGDGSARQIIEGASSKAMRTMSQTRAIAASFIGSNKPAVEKELCRFVS
jgi:hypothetical protein